MGVTQSVRSGTRGLTLRVGAGLGALFLTAAGLTSASGVVGGTAAGANPAVARITLVAGQQALLCTGEVVSSQWIATAGHCVADPANAGAIAPVTGFTVYLGESAQNGLAAGAGAETHKVTQIVTAQGFDPANPTAFADYSLLKLDTPTQAKPFALATTAPTAGSTVQFYGWGLTTASNQGAPAQALQMGSGVVDQTNTCTTANNGFFCETTPDPAAGACFGDSGGPVLAGGQLAGLVSGLEPTAYNPNVFPCPGRTRMTNLANFAASIKTVIGA